MHKSDRGREIVASPSFRNLHGFARSAAMLLFVEGTDLHHDISGELLRWRCLTPAPTKLLHVSEAA